MINRFIILQIQRLVLVPSLLQSLLMYLNIQQRSDALSDLKLWICSGETLPLKLAENFFQRFNDGGRVLANFYGSTEVMGDVTFHLVSDLRQLHGLEKVPIGTRKKFCKKIIHLFFLCCNRFHSVKSIARLLTCWKVAITI